MTGAVILSEIGDISKFNSPRKLVAFAGLDATVTQSGEFETANNVMSKRGSPYLRKAIIQYALIASFKDPVLSIYYQKKKSEGKHHLTCVGAVARKMWNIIYAILKNNRSYVPKSKILLTQYCILRFYKKFNQESTKCTHFQIANSFIYLTFSNFTALA